jgi:hypothetical protein
MKIEQFLSQTEKSFETDRASENYFVTQRDEIAKGIDGFLAQPEVSRASTVTLVDLVHVQFLNFGCNEKQREKSKCSHRIQPKTLTLWYKN